MLLKNKTALITGSNRGIGLSILRCFAEQGCNILAHSRQEDLDFIRVTEEISKDYNVDISLIYFDLEDSSAIKSAMRSIFKAKMPVDILVNSAGIIHGGLFQMTPIVDIRRVLDINLFGMLEVTQLVCKYMVRKKTGSIINISSVAGIDLSPGNSAYGLSKAAVIAFSKTLSAELSTYGIRVNVVAPSLTDTDMAATDQAKKERQLLTDATDHFVRMAQPTEISDLVCFLASDKSAFINGQVIRIDGGNKF
ncbi:MAG: SDR family NAD(P)-dependent oxidoreductase [Porticoccaceae bacterium]|nr:SDR family NAD(P)-dependent oxidoreductase [Porticoccaceae bacterium]